MGKVASAASAVKPGLGDPAAVVGGALDDGGAVSVVDVSVVRAALVDVVRTGAARSPLVLLVQADTPDNAAVPVTAMAASRHRTDLNDVVPAFRRRAHRVGPVMQRD